MAKNKDDKPDDKTEDKSTAQTKAPDLSKLNQPQAAPADPAQVAEELGEATVEMYFPRACRLLRDDGKGSIGFVRGVNKVPEQYKDHWYLKSCGAAPTKA